MIPIIRSSHAGRDMYLDKGQKDKIMDNTTGLWFFGAAMMVVLFTYFMVTEYFKPRQREVLMKVLVDRLAREGRFLFQEDRGFYFVTWDRFFMGFLAIWTGWWMILFGGFVSSLPNLGMDASGLWALAISTLFAIGHVSLARRYAHRSAAREHAKLETKYA